MLQNMLKHTFIFTAVPVVAALRSDDVASDADSNDAASAAAGDGQQQAKLLINMGFRKNIKHDSKDDVIINHSFKFSDRQFEKLKNVK